MDFVAAVYLRCNEMENKEKPILFNAEMVRAILDGRKTCTRRLPNKHVREEYFAYDDWANTVGGSGIKKLSEKEFYEQYPPYQPGDILYVRETWDLDDDENYYYKADGDLRPKGYREANWLPSIHMPKKAARIWLRVVDVRLERLHDITEAGALEEGARGTKCDHVNADSCGCTDCMNTGWIEPPIVEFMQIWAGTIKKSELDLYGWKANPYVWRIYFERCDKEGRVADGR